MHIDYSISLTKSLKEANFFKKIYYSSLFFSLRASNFKKNEKFKMVKTKLNQRAFEIIRNIELICFISYRFIKT